MTTPWLPGQRAVIDRRTVVTIDRVTRSGRACVGDRMFNANGWEVGGKRNLEPLTPDRESEMALVERAREVRIALFDVVDAVHDYVRETLGGFGGRIPDAPDVDRAERLAAAIRQVMEGVAP